MLRERVIVVVLLLPLVLYLVAVGGWPYVAGVALVLGLAAREYAGLFRRLDLRPATPLLILGVVALVVARWLNGFALAPPLLTALILGAMAWHLVDYERGAARSGTDFAVTLGGMLYLGWLGAYLVSLRALPDGRWWVLLALPAVWLADSAAFFVGRAIGRRRMSPRLSPKKTWEGYLAGVAAGALGGAGLALLWGRFGAGPASLPFNGLVLGGVVALLAPLGDLGVSMLKREVGVKDTGRLLPGHGGALDRLDSWLWAAALGFYLAEWLLR